MKNIENPTVKEVPVEAAPQPKMRQIVIETNGSDVHLKKADVAGKIELIAILQNLVNYLINQK